MACITVQITLAAATAQQISATNQPFQELHLNPSTNDYYFGSSDVSSSKYFRKVASAGSTVIVGNGPGGFSIDDLRNLYIIGTQGNVINIGAVTG